jgi:phosphoribosylformylglycinamidine synthase
MAVAALDEAVRNVVCVGGDPARTAVLDNFCWGRSDDPQQLGALVRACQACYDAATIYGVPFISGKDSLNNEFALEERDVALLLETIGARLETDGAVGGLTAAAWPATAEHVRRTRRLRIPATLLISALSLLDDVRRCTTPDLKTPGQEVYLVGGLPLTAGADLRRAAAVHALRAGHVAACHDVSDGGWLVALAEMAIAGDRGVEVLAETLRTVRPAPVLAAGYLVAASDGPGLCGLLAKRQVSSTRVACVRDDDQFVLGGARVPIGALRSAWSAGV